MQEYSDSKEVSRCLHKIEEKLGWGKAEEWHNEMFSELSEKIRVECGILLSPTTLKRVWGRVHYSSAPSISTLNTLAQFAGHENWRAFKMTSLTKKPEKIEKKTIPSFGIIVTSAAFLTILFVSLYSMIGPRQAHIDDVDLDRLDFRSRPIVSGMPNSVVFDFDLAGHKSDNMFIQQYWDKTKRIKLAPDQSQATGIYYYPGYFRAKLLLEGKIVKEHDLFLESEGWMATLDFKPIPKYIASEKLPSDKLVLPKDIINEIANQTTPIESSFHFVDDLGQVSGDNFSLNSTVVNRYNEKWAVCQRLRIVVLGSEGAMIIPFSIPGCVSDLNIMLNDTYISGKENDLSVLGIDFKNPRNIGISIVDKHVKIIVDNIVIYQNQYEESVGRLVGLRYRFLGAGEVRALEVFDEYGSEVQALHVGNMNNN